MESAAADSTWETLVQHYSEPHRAYHNLSHITALLRQADAERDHVTRPEAVELAIWFHDLVYDTRAADNEQRSAACARQTLQAMDVDPSLTATVEACILATQGHEADSTQVPDLPLFLDLDLAILGASEDIYRRYSQAIRTEYQWVAAAAYCFGRSEVLKRFLARPALFHTPAIASRLEAQARRNIERELQDLSTE